MEGKSFPAFAKETIPQTKAPRPPTLTSRIHALWDIRCRWTRRARERVRKPVRLYCPSLRFALDLRTFDVSPDRRGAKAYHACPGHGRPRRRQAGGPRRHRAAESPYASAPAALDCTELQYT